MSVGDDVLNFYYDSGASVLLTNNGTTYYYITNLQGDVMSIVDGTGAVVAEYEYDPYGNIISATGELAEVNPLRYRGYIYDQECSLYYLQSRYYDPSIGRFLNADAYASTGQGVLGHNMFAYCGNNPIVRVDPTGYIYRINESDLGGAYGGGDIATALFVGTLFTAGQNAIQQTINYYVKDITEFCKTAADYLWTQFDNRQPRIHHVIPKGDFSQYGKETQQQLKAMHKQLADAGIGINDPQNLVIISHGSHKSMHTKTYISNIYSIMMVAKDGKPWEVRVMLYFAREYAASQDKYSIGF